MLASLGMDGQDVAACFHGQGLATRRSVQRRGRVDEPNDQASVRTTMLEQRHLF